jgi:caffeoyl-CoA O-methyltransferase
MERKVINHSAFRDLMNEMHQKASGCVPIDETEGELLRTLTSIYSINNKMIHVLEVGTCVGYSTCWLFNGIIQGSSNGSIHTIEVNDDRFKQALLNFTKLGQIEGFESAPKKIKIIHGDALEEIDKINESIDVAFLDANKEEYLRYLELIKSKLKFGGILTAHNVISHKSQMNDFLEKLSNIERWNTVLIPTSSGMALSIKKF